MIIVEAGARRRPGPGSRKRGGSWNAAVSVGHARDRGWPLAVRPGCATRTRDGAAARPAGESRPAAGSPAAAELDHDQETDAQQRVDELDGFLIDFDDEPERE